MNLVDIKQEIIKLIQATVSGDIEVSLEELTLPPQVELGDFAWPVFSFAKLQKNNPVVVSQELADKISEDLDSNPCVEKVVSAGPYINFFLKKEVYSQAVLETNLNPLEIKKEIMIEYSAPNPFKSFHIGHFRNTSLGDALKRIYEFTGTKVVAANLLNNSGMHVAKCLWAYLKFYKGQEPAQHQEGSGQAEKKGEWLGVIYARACKLVEESEENKAEVEVMHQRLEAEDPEIMGFWKELEGWSMQEFYRIYDELGVHFDRYYFDKDLVAGGKEIVKKLQEKKIAIESEGAIIVDLEEYKLGKVVLIKTDGSALYITKDLYLAVDRFREYKISGIIYVVGMEQNLHFKQLFKILELFDLKEVVNCYHLSYEHMRLPGGKMSSRVEGGQVLYSELIEEIIGAMRHETASRHVDWSLEKISEVAKQLTFGAMKFWVLKHDNNQTIVFDPKQAMSFEGDTGPYLQYTYARLQSILRKAGVDVGVLAADYSLLASSEEADLIRNLGQFRETVLIAGETYRPSRVANYLIDLAHGINTFYHAEQVLNLPDEKLSAARLKLISRAGEVLRLGLQLLGIEVVEEM